MIALKVNQNPFEAQQFTGVNPDFFPDFEIRPGLSRQLGSDRKLNGLDFSVLDWQRFFTATHDLQHSWSHDCRPPLRIFESTKNVSWEQRLFDLFVAI